MVDLDGRPALLVDGAARCWTPDGYGGRQPSRLSGMVEVITPPSIVRTLAAGYVPRVHTSAGWRGVRGDVTRRARRRGR
jgi:hypothetical protein